MRTLQCSWDFFFLFSFSSYSIIFTTVVLGRLAKRVTASEEANIQSTSGGRTVHDLAKQLVDALNPDMQLAAAIEATDNTYLQPEDQAVKVATRKLLLEAVAPFHSPDLRDALVQAQQRDEQTK